MVYDNILISPVLTRLCKLERMIGSGALGNTYFYGYGEPDAETGELGDVYTDLTNGFYYKRNEEEWVNDAQLQIDPIDGGLF